MKITCVVTQDPMRGFYIARFKTDHQPLQKEELRAVSLDVLRANVRLHVQKVGPANAELVEELLTSDH